MIAAEDRPLSGGAELEGDGRDSALPAAPKLPEYDTRTLFEGGREIVIHHAGAAYRMKITKQGKLILNK